MSDLIKFIQFRSPVFTTNSSIRNVLIKLTSSSSSDCLCRSCHLIISWSPGETEEERTHRKAFLIDLQLRQWIHVKSVIQSTQLGAWCYVPRKSTVSLTSSNTLSPCNCKTWPKQLIAYKKLKVERIIGEFSTVRDVASGQIYLFCAPSKDLVIGDVLNIYNMWIIQPKCFWKPITIDGYLVPDSLLTAISGIRETSCPSKLTNWVDSIPGPENSSLLNRVWIVALHALFENTGRCNFLTNAVLNILPSLNPSQSLDVAKYFAKEHLSDVNVTRFSHQLLTVLELSCPSTSSCSWTIKDNFIEYETSFPGQRISLRSLKPSTACCLIGKLVVGNPPSSFALSSIDNNNNNSIPIHLDPDICVARLNPGQLLVISKFTLVIFDAALERGASVTAFGQRLPVLQRLLLVDKLEPISNEVAEMEKTLSESCSTIALVEDSQLEEAEEEAIIFLRYVSPLNLTFSSSLPCLEQASSQATFTVKCEFVSDVSKDVSLSSATSTVSFRGRIACHAYLCGKFCIGSSLKLTLPIGFSFSSSAVPLEPISITSYSIPVYQVSPLSACHHLTDLHRYRVWSVSETIELLDHLPVDYRHLRINLQGHILKYEIFEDPSSDGSRSSLWIIDKIATSSPLRIDFYTSQQSKDFSLLPLFTHVCLFKARLSWSEQSSRWCISLPLSPNRFQVSAANPASLFFPPRTPPSRLLDENNLVFEVCDNCSVKKLSSYHHSTILSTTSQHSIDQELGSVSFLQQLEHSKDEKSAEGMFLVHLIKCLEMRVEFSNCQYETEKARVHLKLLMADGSATGIAFFDTQDFCQTTTKASFKTTSFNNKDCHRDAAVLDINEVGALSAVLGLDPKTIRQLIGHVTGESSWIWPSNQQVDDGDLLATCLSNWFASPGFIRPLHLRLCLLHPPTYRDWQLRTAVLGNQGEVRLATPPHLKLRVMPFVY